MVLRNNNMSEKYYVAGFFDKDYRGVDDNLMTDSYDDAIDFAWKLINDGDYIQLKNNDTGEEYRFEPDEVLDGTDYELGNLEDIFHSVFTTEEPLEEESYGGAFDIEDNQFFTRDDLNELAYAVEEYADGELSVDDIYMEDNGKTVTIEVSDIDGDAYTLSQDIDFRAIRKPNDLLKYAPKIYKGYKNRKSMFESCYHHTLSHDEKIFSESIETPYGPYWYYTKHGVGPGSVPRDITILKCAYDEENDPWGEYFLSDKLLTTDDLRRYDLKEKTPPKGAVDKNGNIINPKDAEEDDPWGFNESLKESKRGFLRKYKGCSIHDAGDVFVCTNEHGLNIGQSRTEVGCEGIIDDYIEKKGKKNESLNESEIESIDDMIANAVQPMADAIHKAEDDGEGKFYVTYNFGIDDNGAITGGVDIRCRKDEYEEQAKATLEDIFNKYGYELDSRFKVNPGKTLFGGTHYQVIKKMDESLKD